MPNENSRAREKGTRLLLPLRMLLLLALCIMLLLLPSSATSVALHRLAVR